MPLGGQGGGGVRGACTIQNFSCVKESVWQNKSSNVTVLKFKILNNYKLKSQF